MDMVRRLISGIAHRLGIGAGSAERNAYQRAFMTLRTTKPCKGRVLIALWIEPFLLKEGEPVPNTHVHYGDSLQIARTFTDLGYTVDVIDYRNRTFKPKKDYAFFVAFRTNFERISLLLNRDCIRIVHLDTAHWLFNNSASYRRGLALQERKGVTLKGLRVVEHNMAIESADYATLLGNRFTVGTYAYAQKPIFLIPMSTCAVYPWTEDKDYERALKRYLWFGSGGLVHKGLDLILEAFASMPDYHLTICGPIKEEPDFVHTYHKELFETPNIHTAGWVDIEGDDFIGITRDCIGLIYPSCSEGQAGSIITCLHAGLIPIVSYESGVDVDDFGLILKDCSPAGISGAIRAVSGLPGDRLRSMSRGAWEFARSHHTRERFAEEYKKAILSVMDTEGKAGS